MSEGMRRRKDANEASASSKPATQPYVKKSYKQIRKTKGLRPEQTEPTIAPPHDAVYWFRAVLIAGFYFYLSYHAQRPISNILRIPHGTRVQSLASGVGALVNGTVMTIMSLRCLFRRPYDVIRKIYTDSDTCFMFFFAYLLGHGAFMTWYFTPRNFVFIAHHVLVIGTIWAIWKTGRCECQLLTYIFLGECTNLPFNLWVASREVIDEGVAWIPEAEAWKVYLANVLVYPYGFVRFVVAPLVMVAHFYYNRRYRNVISPWWAPYVWMGLGATLCPASMPTMKDLLIDSGYMSP